MEAPQKVEKVEDEGSRRWLPWLPETTAAATDDARGVTDFWQSYHALIHLYGYLPTRGISGEYVRVPLSVSRLYLLPGTHREIISLKYLLPVLPPLLNSFVTNFVFEPFDPRTWIYIYKYIHIYIDIYIYIYIFIHKYRTRCWKVCRLFRKLFSYSEIFSSERSREIFETPPDGIIIGRI